MKYFFILFVVRLISSVNRMIKKNSRYSDDVLFLSHNISIGDLLVCIGSLEKYRSMYPDLKFSLVCKPSVAQFAEETGLFPQIYIFKNNKQFLLTAFRLKVKKLIIFPPNWLDDRKIEYMISIIAADEKISARNGHNYYSIREKNSFDRHYTRIVDVSRESHFMERCAEFFSAMTGEIFTPCMIDLRKKIEPRSDAKKYFVVNLGGSFAEKCWPIDRFSQVIEYICLVTCLKPVLVGSKQEDKLSSGFCELYHGVVDNYCGKTTMHELINLIGNAAFYFGNDTGTSHIAAACGVPGFSVTAMFVEPICMPYPDFYEGYMAARPIIVTSGENKKCKYCADVEKTESCKKCLAENKIFECIDDISVDEAIQVIKESGILDRFKRKNT